MKSFLKSYTEVWRNVYFQKVILPPMLLVLNLLALGSIILDGIKKRVPQTNDFDFSFYGTLILSLLGTLVFVLVARRYRRKFYLANNDGKANLLKNSYLTILLAVFLVIDFVMG